MAMLLAYEAQAFSHTIGTFFFVETIYVHHVIILLLGLGAVAGVPASMGEGDGGFTAFHVAIDLSDGSNVLVEISRNFSHEMDGVHKVVVQA
jgi:hypothetical protein